jgi:hypothetical protein
MVGKAIRLEEEGGKTGESEPTCTHQAKLARTMSEEFAPELTVYFFPNAIFGSLALAKKRA